MWTSKQSSNRQTGFTLVELAIVLVIIGLILGAVLKGQQMIENGRVKSVENDLKGVATAYYAYLDRYKAIPGDDLLATTHVSSATVTAAIGDGNGIISGLFDAKAAPAAAAESNNFWQHTRLAGFMTGEATTAVANPPNNALGGVLGIQGGTAAASIYGMTGNVVCASNIPLKTAQAVDIALDDGNSDTGTIRAGTGTATATATSVSSAYGTTAPTADTVHTVCMKI